MTKEALAWLIVRGLGLAAFLSAVSHCLGAFTEYVGMGLLPEAEQASSREWVWFVTHSSEAILLLAAAFYLLRYGKFIHKLLMHE